jgi:hypothetical protein
MQFGVRATLSLVVDDAVWGVADLVACGVVWHAGYIGLKPCT